MKKLLKIIFTIVFVLVVDLTTKHFLFNVEYFNLIPGVISIMGGVKNTGAAWGILGGNVAVLIVITAVMVAALMLFNHFVKNKNTFYCLAFGFIIGGAIGNLIDRVVFQYVRDFIFLDFFPTFPVFNMADSFLCVGAVMLAIFILFMNKEKHEK